MDDMMNVIDVSNELIQENLGFMILWQPNTSQWISPCGELASVNVWLRLHDVLNRTDPENDSVRWYLVLHNGYQIWVPVDDG